MSALPEALAHSVLWLFAAVHKAGASCSSELLLDVITATAGREMQSSKGFASLLVREVLEELIFLHVCDLQSLCLKLL